MLVFAVVHTEEIWQIGLVVSVNFIFNFFVFVSEGRKEFYRARKNFLKP